VFETRAAATAAGDGVRWSESSSTAMQLDLVLNGISWWWRSGGDDVRQRMRATTRGEQHQSPPHTPAPTGPSQPPHLLPLLDLALFLLGAWTRDGNGESCAHDNVQRYFFLPHLQSIMSQIKLISFDLEIIVQVHMFICFHPLDNFFVLHLPCPIKL
jgi:hypothetical protein